MSGRKTVNKGIALLLSGILCFTGGLPAGAAEQKASQNPDPSYLAHYPLTADVNDISGNNSNARITGNITFEDGLTLPGNKVTTASDASYVTLPEGLFDNRNEVTISVWLKSNTNAGNYAALFFGSTPQNNKMPLNYWLFNPTNPSGNMKTVVTNTANPGAPYNTEVGVANTPTGQYKGVWTHYTTVITNTSITGYINGVNVGTAPKTRTVSDYGAGLQSYIGRSNYIEDPTYAGSFQDLRIYGGAMNDLQVDMVYKDMDYVNNTIKQGYLEKLIGELSIEDSLHNGVVDTQGQLALPKEQNGLAITWDSDNESVISKTGMVTLPKQNTAVKLTASLFAGGLEVSKVFHVYVIAKNGMADYWKEKLVIPYVLGAAHVLPVQLGDATITWSGDPDVSEDGKITPSFEGSRELNLTASISVEGKQAVTKEFRNILLGTDAQYVLSYTRTPDSNHNVYSSNLAYSMHLGYSEDGISYRGLHDNTGVLFVKAASNADDTLTRKGLKNPYLFHMKDGSVGVIGERTEQNGTSDASAQSSAVFFTSKDLMSYEEVGMLDLHTNQGVHNPVCEYDSEADNYRITWTGDDGAYYDTTIVDLYDLNSAENPLSGVRQPVLTVESGISTAVDGNIIPVNGQIGTRLKNKLSKIVNTSVTAPDTIYASTKEEVSSVKATAYYNDGSETQKLVKWDTGSVDWNKDGEYLVKGTVQQDSYAFPMINNRADPMMAKYNGKYYFISTDENGQSRFFIRQSATIGGIANEMDHLILDGSSYPSLFVNCLWAPELHTIGEDLYLFFAGSMSGWSGVQCYVMKLKTGGDPTSKGDWETPNRVVLKDGSHLYDAATKGITLDMTYFEAGEVSYVMWAQRQMIPVDTGSWLYIASVDTEEPWKLTSDPVLVSKPDYGWDNNNTFVDEGPFIIQTEDYVFATFSGAGVDPTYCVGMLTASQGSDLLDSASWTKGNYPLLTSSSVPGEYGPGHNSYVTDENGNLLNVYHAKPGINGARSAGIRRVHFDMEGIPVLDMTEDRDLKKEFKSVSTKVIVSTEKVTLTYQAGTGGKITGTRVQTIQKGAGGSEVTAVPDSGYRFIKWSDGVLTAKRTDKEIQKNISVTAIFEMIPVPPEMVTVTYQAGTGGSITGTSVQTISKGTSTSLVKAVAHMGYTFQKWSDGLLTAERSDKGVTTSRTVTAEFTKNEAVPQKVKLSRTKLTLGVKESVTLKVTVSPSQASQKVTWSTSSKSKAAVSSKGKITGKKEGTVKITVKTANKKEAVCIVTVKKAPSKITLNGKSKTLKKGKSYQLKVKIPKGSASSRITYSSNNKKAAVVSSNGKITAKRKGKAVITARTFNGKKAKISIVVK